MAVQEETSSLKYTPTWIVAGVCSVIVLISLCVERLLHRLGKFLIKKHQDALFEALQKLKEELMLLGFISLLLTVFQGLISHLCIPMSFSSHMLPCKKGDDSSSIMHHRENFSLGLTWNRRHLLSTGTDSQHCAKQGKVPLLSIEALHQLHIFIFVLALVHVVFCATTMVLGGLKIRQWKRWEDSISREALKAEKGPESTTAAHYRHQFVKERVLGFWTKSAVVSWIISFFKQFYASVTASDYTALRSGFITTHFPTNRNFDFHKYMMRALEADFKRVVGISWYLWLFVVIFLLLNVDGWHTYFWLSFLPLILLLVVGAKLEHIITRMAQEVAERQKDDVEGPKNDLIERQKGDLQAAVKLSDKHFWFSRPGIVLYLIHFILFQNSFEIAFFFWIWSTYGFDSCIMEEVAYIVPRLIIGVIIQVLCSYSTLPLYAIVTQMGSMFKVEEHTKTSLHGWAEGARRKKRPATSWWKKRGSNSQESGPSMKKMAIQVVGSALDANQPVVLEGITTSLTEI
ncbi:MLO-like protein 13 [Tasmannia lanceolata]|uniref:MLO-like protein 13 n=1 Tax=Tasmannia lanceolata TaxID=3420 RepID=UPI004063C71A